MTASEPLISLDKQPLTVVKFDFRSGGLDGHSLRMRHLTPVRNTKMLPAYRFVLRDPPAVVFINH